MNVLFLMTLNAGTGYWRMFNPAKHMDNNNGCKVILFPDFDPSFGQVYLWEMDLLRDSALGEHIGNLLKDWADIVVGQRIGTHAGLAVIDTVHHHGKKWITEIDDNVFEVPADHPAFKSFYPGGIQQQIAREQLEISDGLIVTTEYLKKTYKRFNKNIYVIPNSIDFDLWKPNLKRNRRFVNIGYVGGGQHNRDLKVLQKVIPAVLEKYKNTRFIIWGGRPEMIPNGPRVKNIQTWVPVLDYPKELRKLGYDIGLAPLVDNYLTRSKSNLRWLEYSALGIPTIASPIEPFNHVSPIFLAKTSDDWVYAISHLVENKEARETVGNAAQEKVKKNYNIQDTVKKYIKILSGELK